MGTIWELADAKSKVRGRGAWDRQGGDQATRFGVESMNTEREEMNKKRGQGTCWVGERNTLFPIYERTEGEKPEIIKPARGAGLG